MTLGGPSSLGILAPQPPPLTEDGRGGGNEPHQRDTSIPAPAQPPAVKPKPDEHGMHKRYREPRAHPKHNPDAALTSIDLYDSPHHQDPNLQPSSSPACEGGNSSPTKPDVPPTNSPACEGDHPIPGECAAKLPSKPQPEPYAPFPNLSSFELGDWFYGQGTQKSLKDFKALISILTSPDFSLDDIRRTKWTTVFRDLGKNKEEVNAKRSAWIDDSGWRTSDISIEVPVHQRMAKGKGVEKHISGTLYHRSIVSIVEEKIRNAEDSKMFHFDGHELVWTPDASHPSAEFRIFSKLYQSDVFLKAQQELRDSPPPQIGGCSLPRVVVGLMFWSDATHLSTFSNSKLWPLYMLFGNESKHSRTRGACHHVAYFDAVSPLSII